MNLLSAWLVHTFTASGAIVAFLGVVAVLSSNYRAAFLWMLAAMAIDATDGLLARALRVKERLPDIDGARIDDTVDYLTFVFLPMLLLYHAGALPAGWGIAVVSIVLIASMYGFVAPDAKTDDHFFTGFPSYWNIVAFYLYLGSLPVPVNAAVLVVLSALVFWRVGYVYPSRTETLRPLTIVLGAVWALTIAAMILMLPDVPGWLVAASLFYPVYYVALSAALNVRRRRPALARS
jgi:phosphatidylcholine synthase